jgi:hypothetical protein
MAKSIYGGITDVAGTRANLRCCLPASLLDGEVPPFDDSWWQKSRLF